MKFSLLKLALLAVLPVVVSSCKIEKRLHRPGYHVEWKKPINKQSEVLKADRADSQLKDKSAKPEPSIEVKTEQAQMTGQVQESPAEIYADLSNKVALWSGTSVLEKLLRENTFQEECEVLVMTDGRKLDVKLLEISQTEIKYRKCNYPDGPVVVLDREDVDRVLYANGAVDIISGYSAPNETTESAPRAYNSAQTVEKKMDVLALLSMIFAIVGVFIAGIPLGIAAVVMAIISLGKFARYPDRFSGKGMAIVGLILGVLAIVGALVVISMAA